MRFLHGCYAKNFIENPSCGHYIICMSEGKTDMTSKKRASSYLGTFAIVNGEVVDPLGEVAELRAGLKLLNKLEVDKNYRNVIRFRYRGPRGKTRRVSQRQSMCLKSEARAAALYLYREYVGRNCSRYRYEMPEIFN
jgi:hypothetical protein